MALPVGDINPTSRRAWVTGALLALNATVFVLGQAPLSGCDELVFLYRFGAVPTELLRLEAVGFDTFAQQVTGCAGLAPGKSVPLSAVTSMFLHGNLGHLLGNLLFLWVFGANVEDRLGPARYLAFYLVGGLVATYVFAIANPAGLVPLVGASGAIAAVLGAYLVCFPRARVLTYVPFPLYLLALVLPGLRIRSVWLIFAIVTMPAWLILTGWFVWQLESAQATAAGGGVAYEAHIGGFVAGVLLLLLLDRGRGHGDEPFSPPRRPPEPPDPDRPSPPHRPPLDRPFPPDGSPPPRPPLG